MPFRRFNTLVYRFIQEILLRYGQSSPKFLPKIAGNVLKRANISGAKAKTSYFRKVLLRQIVRGSRGRVANFVRPFATFRYHQLSQREFESSQLRKQGLLALNGGSEKTDVVQRIRHIFGTNVRYNKSLEDETMPSTISGYEIGRNIACGCNGVVYELRRKNDGISEIERIYMDLAESDPLKKFPLALKIMFNYQYGRPDHLLWKEMGPEILPLPNNLFPKEAKLFGRFSIHNAIERRHPNLIKMHTAFIDVMPILPDAKYLYPEVLPNSRDFDALFGSPKTLFIVMKRYRLTLRNYVITHKRNYWTGRVLLGQLLEAIVFLQENRISHRDMKSDNILLDLDHEDDVPFLVLSDFGSAISLTSDWSIPFPHEDTDLGGNLALRAPEVRRALPGSKSHVHFQKADLWACGTLAYEIFTRVNPFYSLLSSATYAEEELPSLSSRIPSSIRKIVGKMLRVDPAERVGPQIVANVLGISLFRFGQDIRTFLEKYGLNFALTMTQLRESLSTAAQLLGTQLEKRLDTLVELYAAETMLAKQISPRVISDAELQLRATFLSRLDREEVWAALPYFLEEENLNNTRNTPTTSSDCTPATTSTATTL